MRNQRKDYLHKLSRRIADHYDAAAVEDIDMKAMSQCLKFGKSVMDDSFGMFRSMLGYKLSDRGESTGQGRTVLPIEQKMQLLWESEGRTAARRAGISLRVRELYGP